jgi:hypothetical protein
MLNSCASGVSVVNINNGFGAGFQAALIARVRQRSPQPGSNHASPDGPLRASTRTRKPRRTATGTRHARR